MLPLSLKKLINCTSSIVKINPVHIYKLRFSNNKSLYHAFNNLLGFIPGKIEIYQQALTHSSYKNKGKIKSTFIHNERLEFLGDAILDSIVAEILFKKFPFKDEGFLTEMRSKVVSRTNLAILARKMGIIKYIQYDQYHKNNKNFLNQISGNALEALFGAIYLDKGYKFTFKFFENRIFRLHIDIDHLESEEISYKGKLFKWCQKNHQKLELKCDETISNGKSIYKITVLIAEREIAFHEHTSKKSAEELACTKACAAMITD